MRENTTGASPRHPGRFFRALVAVVSALMTLTMVSGSAAQAPGFVDLTAVDASISLEVRYHSVDNFVGTVIDGYEADRIFITLEAAQALIAVQAQLQPFGLGLKVFDAYRPQQAVDHFVRWARDLDDQRQKSRYYPEVDKANLFSEGYIASRSGHSRGSTVDLTLVDLASRQELDMGTSWDYFDPLSWPVSREISPQQRANRLLLRQLMLENGFLPYEAEWWHFTLADEPFPQTYFDFPVAD